MAAKKKAARAKPAGLDLNAFREPAKKVTIGEADYDLQPFNLGNFETFGDLRNGFKDAGEDLAKQSQAAIAVYKFILPTAPDAILRSLSPDQQKALADFWLTGAVTELEDQEEDAEAVLKDPTPPA
jgi:hypothetical protein